MLSVGDYYALPFAARAGLLLILLGGSACYDLATRGVEGRRWREYGFVGLAGIATGVVGVFTDSITSWISPDYFIFGKGILPGDGFPSRVRLLGIQAGFVAGVVGAGLLLFSNNPRKGLPAVGYKVLVTRAVWCLAFTVATASVGGVVFRFLQPYSFLPGIEGFLGQPRALCFVTVWGIHSGLYLGLILAIGGAWRQVQSCRRTLALGLG